jgi:hypothetical protein
MRVLRPVDCTFPFIISIIKQLDLPVTQSTYLVLSLPQTNFFFKNTSIASATMPSNTSHIQQRAQLKQHDDLVVPTDEHVEWQAQNEFGSTLDFQSIGAPVRTCAVGSPNSTSENLTTKQDPDSRMPWLRLLRDCRKEMSQMQGTKLAIQARFVL